MRLLFTIVALGVLAGPGFAQPPAAIGTSAPDLTGKWSGYWVSDKNNHTGPLRANFRQHGCDSYRVTFSGRFAKVIPFRYTTTMDVIGRGDGVVLLAAERPLGLRGSYRTMAVATGTNFDATFTSPRDWGRFVLRR